MAASSTLNQLQDSSARQNTTAPVIGGSMNRSTSATAIPSYPTNENIVKPVSTNVGAPHDTTPVNTADLASSRTRASLSYADEPRRNRGGNGSGAVVNADNEAEAVGGHARKRSMPGPSHSRSQSGRISTSQSRKSLDNVAGRASGAFRRSMSLVRRSGTSGPIDPTQEPRKSIGKRPDELHLGESDPHNHRHEGKRLRRAIPFAAPYHRSGVVIEQPAKLSDWAVPGPLTFGHGQWFYLVCGQSLVAAIISGSINFGVAVALYKSKDTINVWTFNRQTVAGDMGVTVIIQQIVSFIITSSLVHHDLYAGPIGPLRRPWPPLLHLPSSPVPEGHWLGTRLPEDVEVEGKPCRMGRSGGRSKKNGWWWWFVRAVLTGSERNDLLAAGISWRQRLERLVWTAAQGFFLCCLTFWWYWPIAIAIVAPIYEHRELAGTWIPMIIKLLYGAILSLLTNPIMALMAMGAESSVRRCYPELPMWEPFGGIEDLEQWKIEHGVTDAAEVGEAGYDGEGEATPGQTETMAHSQSGGSSDEQDPAQSRTGAAEKSGSTSERQASGYQTAASNLLERRITEEPRALLSDEAEPEQKA